MRRTFKYSIDASKPISVGRDVILLTSRSRCFNLVKRPISVGTSVYLLLVQSTKSGYCRDACLGMGASVRAWSTARSLWGCSEFGLCPYSSDRERFGTPIDAWVHGAKDGETCEMRGMRGERCDPIVVDIPEALNMQLRAQEAFRIVTIVRIEISVGTVIRLL